MTNPRPAHSPTADGAPPGGWSTTRRVAAAVGALGALLLVGWMLLPPRVSLTLDGAWFDRQPHTRAFGQRLEVRFGGRHSNLLTEVLLRLGVNELSLFGTDSGFDLTANFELTQPLAAGEYRVQGTMQGPGDDEDGAAFEPGASHDPRVRRVWVTLGSMAVHDSTTVAQHLDGVLTIHPPADREATGRLTLRSEGGLFGGGGVTEATARFATPFTVKLPRPTSVNDAY